MINANYAVRIHCNTSGSSLISYTMPTTLRGVAENQMQSSLWHFNEPLEECGASSWYFVAVAKSGKMP